MRHIAGLLTLACLVVRFINEGARLKYGFLSNQHFILFWLIWALVITGLGRAVGLLLCDVF